MVCIKIPNGIMCVSPFYRLRLDDGGYVFMDWHHFCGPTFYRDKWQNRMIDDWWDDPLICKALAWFEGRGKRT